MHQFAPKALSSTETSNVLVPGHRELQDLPRARPGACGSRCFECHTYHDWSKRKEVKPAYSLPVVQTGGR